MTIKKWLGAAALIAAGTLLGGGAGVLGAAAVFKLADALGAAGSIPGMLQLVWWPVGGAAAGAGLAAWMVATRMGGGGPRSVSPRGVLLVVVFAAAAIFAGGAAGYLAGQSLDDWLYRRWGPGGDQRDLSDDLLGLIWIYSGTALGAVAAAVAAAWVAARLTSRRISQAEEKS
jgi:hypothetical protein